MFHAPRGSLAFADRQVIRLFKTSAMAQSYYIALLLIVALVASRCFSERIYVDSGENIRGRFLADDSVDDDILEESVETTVYQQASSTTGQIVYSAAPQSWAITYINASLELDTEATYSNNFRTDSPNSWANGYSRFNVTVTLSKSGSVTSGNAASPQVTAALHTVSCQGNNWATSYLGNTQQAGTTSSYSNALTLNISSSGSSNTNLTNSTVYNFLVDYDDAKSIVIYGNGQVLACQNMQPPFPNFPSDWSATIETTDVERGFTYVFSETYSQTLNKLRMDLHSFGTDRILITDATSGQTTIIVPQNGSCQARNFGRGLNWITSDDNTTLLSTAEVLHFTKANNVTYLPGFQTVRGIPCEVWQTSVAFSNPRFNISFDVEYYFPVNQWLVAREDYHRLLKRVYMNGTRNGEPFESYDEYVNFRPRTVYNAIFDICAISPYGSNCNCTDQLRRQAFSNLTSALEGDEDIAVADAGNAACKYGGPVPHGFIRAQSGPYVGLTIIGMIGGSLITGMAMYLFYRKRVGVRISDNLGHQKFTDAPDT